MNTSCGKLPLVNLNVPKVESHRNIAGNTPSEESIIQGNEDAKRVMSIVGLDSEVNIDDKVEASEKYLIETCTDGEAGNTSAITGTGMHQGGLRKPHYTRLFASDNKMVFQAACCLPLRVIAASLDGDTVSGRVLYYTYSESEGGKLVYEFQGEGSKLIIDVRRGDSTRAQRLIFKKVAGS